MNFNTQYYKGIPIRLIDRKYGERKALRYTINNTNQNVWIPLKHLDIEGNILVGENLDYVFRKSKRQLEIAGVIQEIIGIKKRTL